MIRGSKITQFRFPGHFLMSKHLLVFAFLEKCNGEQLLLMNYFVNFDFNVLYFLKVFPNNPSNNFRLFSYTFGLAD